MFFIEKKNEFFLKFEWSLNLRVSLMIKSNSSILLLLHFASWKGEIKENATWLCYKDLFVLLAHETTIPNPLLRYCWSIVQIRKISICFVAFNYLTVKNQFQFRLMHMYVIILIWFKSEITWSCWCCKRVFIDSWWY